MLPDPPDDTGADVQERFRYRTCVVAGRWVAMCVTGEIVAVIPEDHEDVAFCERPPIPQGRARARSA